MTPAQARDFLMSEDPASRIRWAEEILKTDHDLAVRRVVENILLKTPADERRAA